MRLQVRTLVISHYTGSNQKVVEIESQDILTKDSTSLSIDGVVMFRVIDAVKAVQNVENYAESIAQLGSTTLRSMLGTLTLSELLVASTEDDDMLNTVNEVADEWGIVVERIEVQNVRLPADLQQAMATEAEASRKAKAKLIHAKAEAQAAEKLSQAAELLSKTPGAIQLRYLQVLLNIVHFRTT